MFERWKRRLAIQRHLDDLGPKLLSDHGRGPYTPDQVRTALADRDPAEAYTTEALILFCEDAALRSDPHLATESGWENLVAEVHLVVSELGARVSGIGSPEGSA